jgi:hypothetical protein
MKIWGWSGRSANRSCAGTAIILAGNVGAIYFCVPSTVHSIARLRSRNDADGWHRGEQKFGLRRAGSDTDKHVQTHLFWDITRDRSLIDIQIRQVAELQSAQARVSRGPTQHFHKAGCRVVCTPLTSNLEIRQLVISSVGQATPIWSAGSCCG